MRNVHPFFGKAMLIILFIFQGVSVDAQLTVVQGAAMSLTPLELIQQYLVGQGVTISNATFNGSSAVISSNQVGNFVTHGTATTQLGLDGGILLTSGKASIAIGPNNQAGAGFAVNGPGDPDLNTISSSNTNDKAVLEFDFIPQFDTVRFRYVFGSEEFFEYCNAYNDAFGFFLSGPGINGTFTNNAINIALMPGSTSTYVTINNICANVLSRWDNSGGQNYQYDALTHVFTAWHIVQPCSTYHIKLAIADAVDKVYDSGVFLEQNSFGSPGVTLQNFNSVPSLGNRALEGCNDVYIGFALSQTVDYTFRVNLTISGTAINGVDYNLIPNVLTFPPGVDSVALVIHPKSDTLPEGRESVIIKINQVSCNGTVVRDTVWIDDYVRMQITPDEDTSVCHGTTVTLSPDVTGGLRPFTYQWNIPLATDSVLTLVPPVGVNPYIMTVTDLCGLSEKDTTVITVLPNPVANAGSNVSIPNGTSTTLNGSASGGMGNYSYSWISNPPGFTSSIQNPPTGNLYTSVIFILVVTDLQTGCQSEPAEVIVAVVGGPLSVSPIAQPSVVCLGSTSHLYALAGGGSGLYTYSWSSDPPGFTSSLPDPEVLATENTTYTVVANDGFNDVTGSTGIIVNPVPLVYLGPADTTVCTYDSVKLDAGNPGSTYMWSNGSSSRSLSVTSSGMGFEVQTYTVWVTNEYSCQDSATINVIFTFSACTGISDNKDNLEFRVFPNPSKGIFTIQFNPSTSHFNLEIYNLMGVKVYEEGITVNPGHPVEKNIDASFLPSGIYILRLQGENFSGMQKILIK